MHFLDAGRRRLAGLGRCRRVVPARLFGDPGAVERGTPDCSSNSRLRVAGMIAPIDPNVSATPWCDQISSSAWCHLCLIRCRNTCWPNGGASGKQIHYPDPMSHAKVLLTSSLPKGVQP